MSKIGVGVGEEFPVDEDANPQTEDLGTCYSRNAERRAQWRRFRQQMREEWRARRRAWRDRFNRRETVEVIDDLKEKRLHHLVLGGLALVGIAAILGALRNRD